MVLADPRLVIAEPIEPFDQLHVARHRQRRVLAEAMKRREENAEFHAALRHPGILQQSSPLSCPDCRPKRTG